MISARYSTKFMRNRPCPKRHPLQGEVGAYPRVARTEGEQLDNAPESTHPPAMPRQAAAHDLPTPRYDAENLRSLIAAKSVTSPPTRLVA